MSAKLNTPRTVTGSLSPLRQHFLAEVGSLLLLGLFPRFSIEQIPFCLSNCTPLLPVLIFFLFPVVVVERYFSLLD